jgi:hypothetical protein
MKKNNKGNVVPSYLSNNPMMDAEAQIDMPIINAQAYDVPLPYCDSTRHMRGVRRGDGESTRKEIKK